MPALTVLDHQALADIARLGGYVMMTKTNDGHEDGVTTASGHPISTFRVHRLIAAEKLISSDDGLFPGFAQTYRLA